MISRLRTLRLARGLTLKELHERMGGGVTIVALSRFERGLLSPSAQTAERLAQALSVRREDLYGRMPFAVTFLQYRRKSSFGKRDETHLRHLVQTMLEQRVRVQELVAPGERPVLPRRYRVRDGEDAERAAEDLRRFWNLGTGPIGNLTAALERRLIHVLAVEMPDSFDGLSALVHREGTGELIGAAVVSRCVESGERWRMNLAHELGHLVLEPTGHVDEEKAAFRFAGSLLAPADALYDAAGVTRNRITLEELMDLRSYFGVSLQGLLYRMRVLGILTEDYTNRWWRFFAKNGWRKKEPGESAREQSVWLQHQLRRACSELLLTAEEARSLLPPEETLAMTGPVPKLKEFMEQEGGEPAQAEREPESVPASLRHEATG